MLCDGNWSNEFREVVQIEKEIRVMHYCIFRQHKSTLNVFYGKERCMLEQWAQRVLKQYKIIQKIKENFTLISILYDDRILKKAHLLSWYYFMLTIVQSIKLQFLLSLY